MSRFTNEFKVGLLGIVAAILLVIFILRTDDRPDDAIQGYTLYAFFPTASGLYPSTQVQIAGVSIGSVRAIELSGELAKITLEMSASARLPTDSVAELQSEGILGDRTVKIVPGSGGELLGDGDQISTRKAGLDTEKLSAQATEISEDVAVITKSLRTFLEDEENTRALSESLQNVEALTSDMKAISAENRAQISATVENLRQLSEALKQVTAQTGETIKTETETVNKVLARLDSTLAHIESITAKIDAGEGTIGSLVNDDKPVQQLNAAFEELNASLEDVGELVSGVTELQTDVQYHGHYFFGSDPSDPSGYDNPVAGDFRNRLGLKLQPREDLWYLIELVDYPLGVITYEETVQPDLGTAYREYMRTLGLRYSLQFARRFGNTALRFGLIESSGGVGVDQYLLRDRLTVTAEIYDFTYGSWPFMEGIPNLTFNLRAEPLPHVYLEGGSHNTLLGFRHGFYTGYAGAGFYFNDDDIKWLLSALPVP